MFISPFVLESNYHVATKRRDDTETICIEIFTITVFVY